MNPEKYSDMGGCKVKYQRSRDSLQFNMYNM